MGVFKNRRLRSFSFVVFEKLTNTTIQAVFYLVFALLLNPAQYGQVGYIIAIAGTVSILSRIGLGQTIVVFQSKGEEETVNEANLLALILTGTASVILLFINTYSAILCFGISMFALGQSNLLGRKRYKLLSIASAVRGISIIAFAFLFYFFYDYLGIVVGMAIGNMVGSVTLYKSISAPKNFKFGFIKKKIRVIFQNYAVDSSLSMTRWADKLVIVPFFEFTTVGIYQLNLQILFALSLFPIAIHSFLLVEESSTKTGRKSVLKIASVAIIIAIISWFVLPLVVEKLFVEYNEGIPALRIMLISIIPLSLTSILNAKLQSAESTKVGYGSLTRLSSLLILLIILGNSYGLNGMAYAVLLSTVIETIALFVIYQKHVKND